MKTTGVIRGGLVNVRATYWRGAEAGYAGEVGGVLVVCGWRLRVRVLLRLPVLEILGLHGGGGGGGWERR